MSDSRIIRMNPLVSPRKSAAGANDVWAAPGGMALDQFQYILNLDMDAVETPQVEAISQYADLWLKDEVLNQPVRMKNDLLKCEVGQDSFSAAMAAWKRISQ